MATNRKLSLLIGALFIGSLGYYGGAASGSGVESGASPLRTATLSNGASVEYGTVPIELRSSTSGRTTVTFKNKYKTPPLVFVQQGGRAGTYLALRVEGLTNRTAEIVAHTIYEKMPLLYRTEVIYLAIGEPASQD
jgi:hypothetical protein